MRCDRQRWQVSTNSERTAPRDDLAKQKGTLLERLNFTPKYGGIVAVSIVPWDLLEEIP